MLIKEFVPLIQTLLWIVLLLSLAAFIRPEIALIRRVLMERIEKGIAIKIGPLEIGELREGLRQLEERQDTLQSNVRTLQIVVKGLVTEFEWRLLRGLAADGSFKVKFHNSMYRELERLDAIRYIQPQKGYGIVDIRERDGRDDDFDLKQYVYLTDEGLQYLRLRRELFQSSV